MIENCIELITGHESSKGLQPANRAFDDPPSTVASERSTILSCWSDTTPSMRTDEFDTALSQAFPQGIAVGGSIVDQTRGNIRRDRLLEQRLNQ